MKLTRRTFLKFFVIVPFLRWVWILGVPNPTPKEEEIKNALEFPIVFPISFCRSEKKPKEHKVYMPLVRK